MSRILSRTLLAVLLGCIPALASAAPGQLDPGFADRGAYVPPPGCCGYAHGMGVALQADGKIVVAGRASDGFRDTALVTRLFADGTVDTAFGTSGQVRLDLGSSGSYARSVAIQADGRIVVAGASATSSAGSGVTDQGAFVARLQPTGALDATYGNGGIRVLSGFPGGGLRAGIAALALQPDGKAVVAGSIGFATDGDMYLARLDTAGALDASFGQGGYALSGLGELDQGYALAIAADGSIVAAGIQAGGRLALMRVLGGGTLDSSLDADGTLVLGTASEGWSVALEFDGRIVVGGTLGGSPVIFRFLASGVLDNTYNGSGYASLPGLPSGGRSVLAKGTDGYHYALVTDPNDRFAFAGIRRISGSGAVDPAWNTVDPAAQVFAQAAMVLDANGALVIAGGRENVAFGVHRVLTSSHAFDPSFGTAGSLLLFPGLLYEHGTFRSVFADSAGRITVLRNRGCPAGGPAWGSNNCPYLTRLLPDGSEDPSLTTRWLAKTLPEPDWQANELIAGQADGKVLYVVQRMNASAQPPRQEWRLARVNADGSADATFSSNVELDSVPNAFASSSANGSLLVQPDGKILFSTVSTMRRLLADGALDSSYSLGNPLPGAIEMSLLPSGGLAMLDFAGQPRKYDAAGLEDVAFASACALTNGYTGYHIAAQADGKVLVAANGGINPGLQPQLRRCASNGALDPSFGSGGIVGTGVGPMVALGDGRILSAYGGNGGITVLRFLGDGTPDPAFGGTGTVTSPLAEPAVASAMALLPGNGLALAGSYGAIYAVYKILGDALLVEPVTLPVGGVGVPYSSPLTASGGVTPYGFSIQGTPPPGLAINGSALSGTPANAGIFNFTILATDADGVIGSRAYTLTIHSSSSLITSYYQTILGRAPDSQGQAYWEGEAARLSSLGASVSEAFFTMAAYFFTSPEYLSFDATDAEYLTDLYRTFFGRDPDAGGLAYWSGELAAGKPRGAVMNDFLFSAEFADFMSRVFGSAAASRAEISMVMDFYRGLLGRTPDTVGFQYWVGRFQQAQCNGTVAAEADLISSSFLASSEFAQRQFALAPADRNPAYVTDLYNAVLKRGGDRAGFQAWVDALNNGTLSREDVRRAFVGSAEFAGRVQAVLAQGCVPP